MLSKKINIFHSSVAPLIVGAFLGLACLSAGAAGNYYRFINERGVKVMSQTLPPDVAKNGYEIVSASGRVIEVIPPAPKAEEVEAARIRQLVIDKYKALAKRYSSTVDIEDARSRRLVQIEANIAIQKGNLQNISGQMDVLTENAAAKERRGLPVPQTILDHLAELKSQYKAVENLIEARKKEHDSVNKRFDNDVLLFEKGEGLLRGAKIDQEIIDAGITKEFENIQYE